MWIVDLKGNFQFEKLSKNFGKKFRREEIFLVTLSAGSVAYAALSIPFPFTPHIDYYLF